MKDEKEEIIDRLIVENSHINKMINEAKYELSYFSDIDGLSFNAAIKTLIKKCKELISENETLKKENENLKKKLKLE